MPNECVARKFSIRMLMLAIVAVAQLGAKVHATTQGGDARSVSGACLCGNENGTAFPTGQCFVDRTCGEALAETDGSPCTGTEQGNCPNGQFCLDANSACGVPTCAIQTGSCQGSCSVGTGTAPYDACATLAPVAVPAMPIVLTTVLALLLVAGGARILGKQRDSATSAMLAAIALVGVIAALSTATLEHHDSHACQGAAESHASR